MGKLGSRIRADGRRNLKLGRSERHLLNRSEGTGRHLLYTRLPLEVERREGVVDVVG